MPMEEIGTIIEEKGKLAVVLMAEKEAKSCPGCGLCRMGKKGRYLEIENNLGARLGETVRVEWSEKALFKAVFFLYGWPLLGFILGIISGSFTSGAIVRAFILVAFLGVFWFWGLNLAEKVGQENQPKIVGRM